MITKVRFEKFTAFESLEVDCSSGVNVFIGTNGTGKTHILKTIYAACDITKSKKGFAEKINKVFLPSKEQIGRLVKRSSVSTSGFCEVTRKLPESGENIKIRISMSNHTKTPDKASVSGSTKRWLDNYIESVYIPVKEMLSNAPGFRSLYSSRQIAFEEIYADIVDRALLPILRGPTDRERSRILNILQNAMDGKVTIDSEEFFLRNEQGKLEFTLLAEGLRKLGLLWLLIQNGTLLSGSVLCWDEPEANLNPNLMKTIVEILLELHRMGVQIFLATHDYVLLKEFDLQMRETDQIRFHALYRDKETDDIAIESTSNYLDIHPNAIDDTFGDLIDREIERSMGGLGKMKIEVDGFEFDFTNAINALVFDEKDKTKLMYHGLSHAMKAVDLIVELDDVYLFVEVKNFYSPEDYQESGHFNYLRETLKGKYRDSWLYRWAENKVDKPIRYLCLLTLENALVFQMNKEMQKQLPQGIPSVSRWQRAIADSCVVLNLERWNRNFIAWPVSQIRAGGTP